MPNLHQSRTHALRLLFAAGAVLGITAAASAQTWTGNSIIGNQWSDGSNWLTNSPVSNGTANVIFAGVNRLTSLVNQNYDINSLTFNNTAGAFSIGGLGPLTIRAGGITNNDDSSQTLNLPIVLAANQTWNAALGPLSVAGTGVTLNAALTTLTNGQPVQISAPLSGPGSLIKNGTGTLTLAGSNTYGGPTTINQGSLVVGLSDVLSNASPIQIGALGTLNLNNLNDTIPGLTGDPGSTLNLGSGTLTISSTIGTFTFNGVITGTGGVSKTGASTQLLGGANNYSGLTTILNGVVQITADERLDNTSDLTISTGRFELQNFTETLDQVTITGGVINGGGASGTGTIIANSFTMQGGNLSARLAGTTSLEKSNSLTNSVFTGSGSTYTGATSITAGTLVTNAADVFPDTTIVTVGPAGLLQITNFSDTVAGIAGNGIIKVFNTTFTIGAGNANSTFPGVISDDGNTGSITKIGTGSLTLSGVNTYTGTTTLNQGTLSLVGAERLADASDLVVNGGQFIVEDERIDQCTLNGGEIRPVSFENGILQASSFTLNAGYVDATLVGGGIVKAGAGIVQLAGTNNQAFTRIDAGILQVANNAAFGNSNTNVSLNGGTLQLTAPMSLARPFYVFSPSTLDCLGDCLITNLSPNLLMSTLTKTGPGILSIGGTPGSSGSINISGGAVRIGPSISLPLNSMVVSSAGTFTNDAGLLRITSSVSNAGRVQLLTGARITGGSFNNTGILSGTGTITSSFINSAQGDVRIADGESILFSSLSPSNNAGLIEVIEGSVEFTSAVSNSSSTGLIFARDATLRFNAGLTNNGSIASSFGVTDIFGDIDNRSSGVITISGASDATFIDDLINNGTLRTSSGGNAVFLGSVSGSGSFPGTGTVYLEGDLRPGNSPGLMTFGGDVVFGSFSSLNQEIAGINPDQFDRTSITGAAYLDGSIDVAFLNGFSPTASEFFTILTAGEVIGRFQSVNIPPTTPPLHLIYTPTSVILTVCIADYNFDQVVDFFDYLDFVSDFAANRSRADFNDDGVIDFFDYLDFVQAFGAGC